MTVIFFIFAMAIVLMGLGLRKAALILALVNLLFCLGMFWHHVTSSVNILL